MKVFIIILFTDSCMVKKKLYLNRMPFKKGGNMVLKNLFLAGLIMSIVFSGCNKDKNEDTFEELTVDNSEIEPVATDNESDAIFDEFYEESKPEKQESIPAQESVQKTRMQSQPQFSSDGRYVVQVTCVQSKNFARKIAIKLEDMGYPAYIAEVEDPTTNLAGLYHRVRVGGFPTYSSAKDFGDNYLSNDGYEYWVDNRSNDNVGFAGLGLGSNSASKEYEVPSTSKQQPLTNPKASVSATKAETGLFVEQKQPVAPSPVTTPVGSDIPEKSSQMEPPEEPKEMVSEQVQQSVPVETATDDVNEPTPAHNTASGASESPEASESDDDWGELDEEWGNDTSDW